MDCSHYPQMYGYNHQLPSMPSMLVSSPMSTLSDMMQMHNPLSSPHHSGLAVYLPQSPSNHSPQQIIHQHQAMTPQHLTPNHMQMQQMNHVVQEEPMTPMKEKKDKNSPMLYPILYKTKMCKFHLLGVCEKGENCPHAHTSEELRSRPDLSKTSLCRQLVNNGKCDNLNCTFAHTKDELRATPNFFKMKQCKFYYSGQGCSFGEQCRYSHSRSNNENESLPSLSPSAAGRSPAGSQPRSQCAISPSRGAVVPFRGQRMSEGLWRGCFLRNRQMDLCVTMDYVHGYDGYQFEQDIQDFRVAFSQTENIDLTYRVSIPEVNSQLDGRRILCLKVVPGNEEASAPFAEYIDYYQKRQRAGAAVMDSTGPLYVLPVSLALQVKVLDSACVASIGSLMESRTNRQFLVGLLVCDAK